MALVKSQGSSRHKGKEAISNPPATLDIGEEAEYYKLEHFNEEEAQRDPDNECAPLIDPLYDVCPHFPKILGDYTPPQPARVWLALNQQNPDIS